MVFQAAHTKVCLAIDPNDVCRKASPTVSAAKPALWLQACLFELLPVHPADHQVITRSPAWGVATVSSIT